MILAADKADRQAALDKLLAMQREDITELFRIMDGLPVTVRLLDPPLHELLGLGEMFAERGLFVCVCEQLNKATNP